MAASAIFKLQTAISPRRADNDHKAACCSPFSVNPGEDGRRRNNQPRCPD
jgi:hypothetical protein